MIGAHVITTFPAVIYTAYMRTCPSNKDTAHVSYAYKVHSFFSLSSRYYVILKVIYSSTLVGCEIKWFYTRLLYNDVRILSWNNQFT